MGSWNVVSVEGAGCPEGGSYTITDSSFTYSGNPTAYSYSTSGNKLYASSPEGNATWTYSLSGDSLTLVLPLPDYGTSWVFHCVRTSSPAGPPSVKPAPVSPASGAPVVEADKENPVKGTWDIVQVTYNTKEAADAANAIVGQQYYAPNVDYDWTSYGQSFIFTNTNFQFWMSGAVSTDSTYEWLDDDHTTLRATANGRTADWTVKADGDKLILESNGVTYVCTRITAANAKDPSTGDMNRSETWILLLAAAAACAALTGRAYAKRRR